MITVAECISGSQDWNEYYRQFVTPAFRDLAMASKDEQNPLNRARVLAGMPAWSAISGVDAANHDCTRALHRRWPGMVIAMRKSGKVNITLSDFLMVARSVYIDAGIRKA